LKKLAAEAGGSAVLITFFPHPRLVLYPDSAGKDLKMINSQDEKIRLLEEIGLDHLIILEFTKDFARTTSEDFVEHFLVGKLSAHTVVVGFNHYFGHNREGNYASLYKAGQRFSFRVEEIPEQEIQNETVSSTRIRRALREGNIQRANAYLEHYYMISAGLEPGIEGMDKGRSPFLRIRMNDPQKLLPPKGSYAASIRQRGLQRKALVQLEGKERRLYPLEPDAEPPGDEVTIYFHLRLYGSAQKDLTLQFERVRELIY
jgi:FAD synthase